MDRYDEDILIDEQKKRKLYYATMKEGQKSEFINGNMILHEPVRLHHNACQKNLLALLDLFTRLHELGFVGNEKVMISLTRNDYEPDICFFEKSKSEKFDLKQLHFPAPDLIVEVISPSTEKTDRGIKFYDYAGHGVAEYWIVDPDKQVVEQYKLINGKYDLVLRSNKGIIKSIAVKNFEIPVDAIFDSDKNLRVLKNILNNIN